MKELAGKVAVVTGAGSGIGRALAQQFAASGCRVAIQDWNAESLAETAAMLGDAEVFTQSFDVADRDAVYAFRDAVIERFGQADIVINNAGVAVSQKIEDHSYEDFEWIMGINFWGMVYGTKAFLPDLKDRPEACVANVSSVFGLFGVPTQGSYNASKFGIRGFTEALWWEMRGTNLQVLSIHPGGISTNIAASARFYVGPDGEDHETGKARFKKLAMNSPEKAARIIIRAIRRKQRKVRVGPDAVLMDWIVRLLPTTYWIVMHKLFPKAPK